MAELLILFASMYDERDYIKDPHMFGRPRMSAFIIPIVDKWMCVTTVSPNI